MTLRCGNDGKEREMYYYNNELPPQQGWRCPKCGRVNAPWLPTCGCVSSQTSGSGTPYLVKTSSISRDSHEIATDEPKTERYCTNCKHNGVIADYECRECCGMDHHEFIEPQTDMAEDIVRSYGFKAESYQQAKAKDEPQTEEWYTYQDEQEYNDRWQTDCDQKCVQTEIGRERTDCPWL